MHYLKNHDSISTQQAMELCEYKIRAGACKLLDKMIQNDILRKIGSGPGTKYIFIDDNFVAHRMQNDNNAGKWKSMNRLAWCGPLLCSLQTALPTLIVVIFGANVVNFILKVIPEWVTDGLSIAASCCRYRYADALHADQEISSIRADRICPFRIPFRTGARYCDRRICSNILVFHK